MTRSIQERAEKAMAGLYRKRSPTVTAWVWQGQPEDQWPSWLNGLEPMLRNGLDHGWVFVDQSPYRARAVTPSDFEREFEPVASELSRLTAENKALIAKQAVCLEALEPFSELIQTNSNGYQDSPDDTVVRSAGTLGDDYVFITVGDLRRARDTLSHLDPRATALLAENKALRADNLTLVNDLEQEGVRIEAYQRENKAMREAVMCGAQVNLPDFLRWIAARLVKVHGENPNVDYVLTLHDRADRLDRALSGAGEPAPKASPKGDDGE